MGARREYAVVAVPVAGWWVVEVAELDVLTQVRALADVEPAARELIADVLGLDPREVAVTVRAGSRRRRRG